MNCNNCMNSIIDVTGICCPKDTSVVLEKYPYWIQMYIPETLCIPPQKPDVEEINSVNINVNILRKKVVKTPIAEENLEGKKLTGRKLIVEGQLCQKVVYTACDEVQSVHSAHFYVPFSAYIVVPKVIDFNGESIDSCFVNYQVNACVEDLSIKLIDERCFLKNVTLLLSAVPTQSC